MYESLKYGVMSIEYFPILGRQNVGLLIEKTTITSPFSFTTDYTILLHIPSIYVVQNSSKNRSADYLLGRCVICCLLYK